MSKQTKVEELKTKRFVIRKSLIGKNTIIIFTNKKDEVCKYDHDAVYKKHQKRFDEMPCFAKYKSYTNSNNLPAFCRDMNLA
jgi:hypothetical protein